MAGLMKPHRSARPRRERQVRAGIFGVAGGGCAHLAAAPQVCFEPNLLDAAACTNGSYWLLPAGDVTRIGSQTPLTQFWLHAQDGIMNDSQGRRYAVIMGDIVRSESSLPLDLLHELFNKVVSDQNTTHSNAFHSPMTITLGDEFQGIVRSLAQAALVARDIRFQLLADDVDCRFVIGLVEIKTPINPDKAWNMMGPGLSRARKKLNQKKADQFYRFSLLDSSVMEVMLDALGAGLSAIERDWTEQQREDISALMSGLSAAELAQRRNVSVHSIYKVRGSGNFDAYSIQWHAIVEALTSLDKQEGLG